MNKQKVEFNTDVTFFVGDNGTGKSTLLESIAIGYGFNPEGGTKNFCFNTKDTHGQLFESLILAKNYKRPTDGFFYRAESFYNVSSEIDRLDDDFSLIDDYGGRSMHGQSHGEALLALIQNRFGGNGLYILDEPESALSPMGLMKLLCLINELVKHNSQFIIATHSPILMSYPHSTIYSFDEDEMKIVKLEETDHFMITKAFTDNHEKMISNLFEE